MKLRVLIAAVLTGALFVLSGCASAPSTKRVVVIMSGGGAVSPFTTPTEACKTGLAAGNSDTALREYLLSKGKEVYTAPAMDDWGQVEPPADSFGAFGDCPEALPEYLTVMSAGDITASAEKLTRFLMYLRETYAVTDIDLVAHSNGGLYSRGAIRLIKQLNLPLQIRSLTMLGTPNEGAFPTAYTAGEVTLDECKGDAFCIEYLTFWKKWASGADKGLNAQDTAHFLDLQDGWNQAQAGYLDDIPVFMIGGSYWENPDGDPKLWPYDGTTPVYSALAQGISDDIIPHRACWVAPLTHSIFTSNYAGLDWQTAMTWNTEALKQVNDAIDNADTALNQPARQGC